MQSTRRDILFFMGGSALGAVFTPAPWRLITDAALWSENWPGIPRPARGEVTARFTNCALCPAGCAVRARSVNNQPVSLAGVAGHPLSRGALCPFGLAGHHLPYHPDRLRQGPIQEAAAAVAEAIAKREAGERVAVLDLRPGRAASWTYRRAMAAVKDGVYLAARQPLAGGACSGLSAGAAIDLAKARTVLSFGVPVLDGWGTPGNVLAARGGFRLIQAEPVESRTASLADEWLRIQPGSDSALALGIANALGSANGFPPAKAAEATGLTEKQIVDLSDELARSQPALVLAGGGVPEALALNELTGALGETIVARAEVPVPEAWKKSAPVSELAGIPDGSIRVLLIDESAPGDYIPWNAIEPKLVRGNPVVVTFAWSGGGYGRHAQFTLPAATYPELTDDIPPAIDSPAAVFRIAAPLVAAPAGMADPSGFIAKAAGIDAGNALRERADAVHQTGRGTLFTYADGKSTPVKEMKADDFWKALNEGACWMDGGNKPSDLVGRTSWSAFLGSSALPTESRKADQEVRSTNFPLTVALCEPRAATALASPILSKLYQESNLLLGPNRVAMHPETVRACGVEDGGRGVLETALGGRRIAVVADAAVPRGMVMAAAGPEILDICGAFSRARVTQS